MLAVNKWRSAGRSGDGYETEVSQAEKSLYNLLILYIFYNDQIGDGLIS